MTSPRGRFSPPLVAFALAVAVAAGGLGGCFSAKQTCSSTNDCGAGEFCNIYERKCMLAPASGLACARDTDCAALGSSVVCDEAAKLCFDPSRGIYPGIEPEADMDPEFTGIDEAEVPVCTATEDDKTQLELNNPNCYSMVYDPRGPASRYLRKRADGCAIFARPGFRCDDNDPKTRGDTCNDRGQCVGVPVTCDDKIACTTDSVDSQGNCVFAINNGFCLINGECLRHGDQAIADQCMRCNSLIPDRWTFASNEACDDGNPCTINEKCLRDQGCRPPTGATGVRDCNDNVDCTDDVCDATKPAARACSNNLKAGFCRISRACIPQGSRKPGALCEICDPANRTDAYSPVTCPDDGLACTTNACDPATGQCSSVDTCPAQAPACTIGRCTASGCDFSQIRADACRIGEACVVRGQYREDERPEGACAYCDPGTPTAWREVPSCGLAQGLASWYRLDADGADSAGNRDAAGTARASADRFSRASHASAFSAQADTLQADAPTLTADYTVAFWVKLTADLGGAAWIPVAIQNPLAANDATVRITFDAQKVTARAWASDGESIRAEGSMFARGAWNHVAFVRSRNGHGLYINGALVTGQALTPCDNCATSPDPATQKLFIGGASPATLFAGDLDDLRIYDRLLAPDEIRALWANYR